jgi:hypothetical protein
MANLEQIPISNVLLPGSHSRDCEPIRKRLKVAGYSGNRELSIKLCQNAKMGYYRATSIVERKDLHTRLEEIKPSSRPGSMQLPPGSLSRISESI